LSPMVRRRRKHDVGRVLVDLAVMAADGGGYSSDLAPMRGQPGLFGPVASQPTAWRLLDKIDDDLRARVDIARAAARKRVWAAGLAPKTYILDFDATLINVHTDKQNATPTYKKGYGFHPLWANSHKGCYVTARIMCRGPRRSGPLGVFEFEKCHIIRGLPGTRVADRRSDSAPVWCRVAWCGRALFL
jgi:Transposase DDE domain group 1